MSRFASLCIAGIVGVTIVSPSADARTDSRQPQVSLSAWPHSLPGQTHASAPALSASVAAGLEDALELLDEIDSRWEETGDRLARTWNSWLDDLATWEFRNGVIAPWMRSFGNGVDYLLTMLDPSGLLPRFNLQTYRILSVRPVDGKVTSDFGIRKDPIHGRVKYHKGIDYRGRRGTPVRAAAPGVVILAREWSAYGNCIVIDHGLGVETRYGHLTRFRVAEGDFVAANAFIGTVGATGRVTGPHLHFEVRENGHPINPKHAFIDRPTPDPEPSNTRELLRFWLSRANTPELLKPDS